jgi:UDP-glucuronate decarboxylase
MREIFVSGGAGFIGSCLSEKLLEDKNNHLIIVDDLSTGDKSKLPQKHKERYRFIKADVNNYKDVAEIFRSFHFDYIFHYAATVGVKRTQENPVQVLNDIHGIEHLLHISKNSGVKRFFFSSSSEVYGEPVELPQNEETTPLNSKVPYAIVKNVGEAFLKSYKKEFDLDYTVFRFFNTYGPKQSKDFVMSKFINLALQNKDIPIYGDGQQTRTFCFINDNVDACYEVFKKSIEDSNMINDVINVGTDFEIPIIELAKKIIKLTNSKSKIVFLPPLEEGDMKRRLPDVSKMKAYLNREMISIDDGIKEILNDTSFIL